MAHERRLRSRFIEEMARYASFYADARTEAAQHLGAPLLAFTAFFVSAFDPYATAAVWTVFALIVAWYVVCAPVVGLATALVYGAIGLGAFVIAGGVTGWVAVAVGAATGAGGAALKLLGRALEGRLPTMADRARLVLVTPAFLVATILFRFGFARGLELAILARRGGHFPLGDPRWAEPARSPSSHANQV